MHMIAVQSKVLIDGFIPGSRASFMLDAVVVGMAVIMPVLAWSIHVVRRRKDYALHRKIQLTLGVVLLIVVSLFEVDVRIYGWRHLAEPSPYYETSLFPVLYVHLFFSVTTTLLWVYTIVGAVRRFDNPPVPNQYSSHHRRVAWASAIFMSCTAVTGWTFYWMAFVA